MNTNCIASNTAQSLGRGNHLGLARVITGLFIVALFSLTAVPTMASPAGEVTVEEYQLYMDWMDGKQDPRLEKFNDAKKMKKIAKNLGVKVGIMKAAVEKVSPLAKDVGKDAEKSIRASLAQTPLKGRIKDVIVDAEQGHVIAHVQWSCGDKRDAEKEMAFAGWAAAQATVVKTSALWCVNSVGTKLLSAKASNSALSRISKSGIERFARARYIRLFEGVKRGPHK